MRFCICLFLSVLLISCSDKKGLEVVELSAYDSVTVPIDYPVLPEYSKLVPYCKGGSVYAAGYNRHIHSIDFVNLSGGDNFIVPLQKEGPDGILPVQFFCFVGDNIVCRDQSGILVLAMDGSVVNRLSKTQIVQSGQYSIGTRGLNNYRYMNSSDGKVLIPLSPVTNDDSIHIGKVYDVSQNSLEFLPPCYPAEVVENVPYLESLSIPDINMYDTDKIVYNFPFSSLVYLYDKKMGKTKVLEIRSVTIDNELDFEEWKGMGIIDRALKEVLMPRFGRVYYSPLLEKYYRVHYGNQEEGNKGRRNMYLMVFNEGGNYVREYLLPPLFSMQYFFLYDTLYFACRNNNDDIFNIAKISLEEL